MASTTKDPLVTLEWGDPTPDAETYKMARKATRRRYDPAIRQRLVAMNQELRLEMLAATERLSKQHGLADQIAPPAYMVARLKGTKGTSQIYDALIALILSNQAVHSQAELREQVENRFPEMAVPKDWRKPLPQFALKKLRTRLANTDEPIRSIQIGQGLTLASLQKAVRQALVLHDKHALSFTAQMTIAKDAVAINGKLFKVTRNKVGKYNYPEVRLKVADLLNAAQSTPGE